MHSEKLSHNENVSGMGIEYLITSKVSINKQGSRLSPAYFAPSLPHQEAFFFKKKRF